MLPCLLESLGDIFTSAPDAQEIYAMKIPGCGLQPSVIFMASEVTQCADNFEKHLDIIF